MSAGSGAARAPIDAGKLLELARGVLTAEANAITALSARLDRAFTTAVATALDCQGRVIVTGIGKSGHIAGKIAATLASTGTPSFFLHPGDASHGDAGMITSSDVVLAISNSGESAELLGILPFIKRRGVKLIAMTGNAHSSLARQADVHLDAAVAQEACPLGLAPTTSTTVALALGDALALALLDARGFTAEEFALSHPGGSLGRRLLVTVADVMHEGERLPRVPVTVSLSQALMEVSRKGLGMTGVVDDAGKLLGVFTDGDLRRSLERGDDVRATPIEQVMARNPHTIGPTRLAVEAVQQMEHHKISGLLVVDEAGRLIGAFNMHDLFRAGVL
jgi:arabinose-5-phosphate isomerase